MPTDHDHPHFFQPSPRRTALEKVEAAQPEHPSRPAGHDTSPAAAHDGSNELLTVEQAAARLAIGRTTMFALIATGAIESVKVGRLRRVPADAITTYINHLAADQRAA